MYLQIGENIKNRRKELNITQKELSKGICTQSQISKIEKNEIIPLSNLLISIANKLDISIDQLVGHKVRSNSIDKLYFDKILLERDYNTLESILSHFTRSDLTTEDKIYLNWLELLVLGNKYDKDISNDLVTLYDEFKNNISIDLSVDILNSIGICYRKVEQIEKAYNYFSSALDNINKHKPYSTQKIKIMYNMNNILFTLKKWEDLYFSSKDILNLSYTLNNYSVVPEIVYSKTHAKFKLGFELHEEDIEEINFAKFLSVKQNKTEVTDLLNSY